MPENGWIKNNFVDHNIESVLEKERFFCAIPILEFSLHENDFVKK
jgi:hypothetical protein